MCFEIAPLYEIPDHAIHGHTVHNRPILVSEKCADARLPQTAPALIVGMATEQVDDPIVEMARSRILSKCARYDAVSWSHRLQSLGTPHRSRARAGTSVERSRRNDATALWEADSGLD
jgi:hypothetical protein